VQAFSHPRIDGLYCVTLMHHGNVLLFVNKQDVGHVMLFPTGWCAPNMTEETEGWHTTSTHFLFTVDSRL